MKYSEVIAPVSRREALTVACPLCEVEPGESCVYTANMYTIQHYPHYSKLLKHRKGSKLAKAVHNPRRAVIRLAREREWERQGSAKRVTAPSHVHAAIAAMRAWDIEEHNRLRDWLAEFGDVLVYANLLRRPDGTVRGDSYVMPAYAATQAALAAREASRPPTEIDLILARQAAEQAERAT